MDPAEKQSVLRSLISISPADRLGKEVAVGLHVCPECGSRLVQPVRWEQTAKRGHWRLWRRCPECEWRGDGVYGEREIDAYDEALDLGTLVLSEGLKALEQENMQFVVDTFVAALGADLITADDFRF